jgi:hypothetical protein
MYRARLYRKGSYSGSVNISGWPIHMSHSMLENVRIFLPRVLSLAPSQSRSLFLLLLLLLNRLFSLPISLSLSLSLSLFFFLSFIHSIPSVLVLRVIEYFFLFAIIESIHTWFAAAICMVTECNRLQTY